MSTTLRISAVLALLMVCSLAKPVLKDPHPGDPVEGNSPDEKKQDEPLGLAYEHYLKEVVDVLESDAAFKKKLETANVTDIKSGKIAMYLELVNHTVRDMLHELKRKELSRLSQLARLQMKAKTGTDIIMNAMGRGMKHFEIPDHLDLGNQRTFEIKDLENLIKKTTSDLEKLDEQRRKEFKEYEMEKKFEEEEHLKELNEDDRKKETEHLEEAKKKHKEHPKLHHPGSKDQFEEVWDKDDHLEEMDFDPKTFFMTHDINGDFEWSIDEVDAVLQRELDKVYDPNGDPKEDDPMEREEEMNRMREHIFTEMDKDKNLRISMSEFLIYTGPRGENKDFQKDEGWKTLDEEDPVFDEDEYMEYVRQFHPQPGVVDPPRDPNLHFNSENHQQQQQFDQHQQQHQQQQQFNQQQQQFNQQQHQHQQQQQQFNQQQLNQQHQQINQQQQQQLHQQQQQHHQQQQQLNQHQQQQQLNQQHQQLNQQPPQQLNQPGQQPPQQQQQQQQQQPQVNKGVPPQADNKVLQQQLHDLQEKLNQQQVQQETLKQQQQNLNNQVPGTGNQQQAQGQGH